MSANGDCTRAYAKGLDEAVQTLEIFGVNDIAKALRDRAEGIRKMASLQDDKHNLRKQVMSHHRAAPNDRDIDLAFFTGCSCCQCAETRNEGRRRGVQLSGDDKLREADAFHKQNVILMTDEERSGAEKVAQWMDRCNWKTEARNVRYAVGLPQKYGPAPDYRPVPA